MSSDFDKNCQLRLEGKDFSTLLLMANNDWVKIHAVNKICQKVRGGSQYAKLQVENVKR